MEITKHLYFQNYIFHGIQESKLVKKKEILPLYCHSFFTLTKAIGVFTFTSIVHNLSFCLQDVRREIFGNVHPVNSVWSTQSSVMGFQTALITWMKKTAVSPYWAFVNVIFLLNINYPSLWISEKFGNTCQSFLYFHTFWLKLHLEKYMPKTIKCVKYMHDDIGLEASLKRTNKKRWCLFRATSLPG